MYGFWAIVLLIGMVNRLFAAVVQWRMRRTYTDSEASIDRRQASKVRLSGARRWIQTHVTLPAVFGYRHQQPLGWCTVPTRIQSFLVFAFVAINLVLCSATYRAFDNNILYVGYFVAAEHGHDINTFKLAYLEPSNLDVHCGSYRHRNTRKFCVSLGFCRSQ